MAAISGDLLWLKSSHWVVPLATLSDEVVTTVSFHFCHL